MKTIHAYIIVALVGLASLATGCASPAKQGQAASNKVVYHFNQGSEQASDGLRNIRNHLAADPAARITVVAHGRGIDFLLEGARDKNGNPYEVAVEELTNRGVEFKVCNNTLVSRNIDKSKVLPQATIVPSGVAELGRLQSQEGYVYIKP